MEVIRLGYDEQSRIAKRVRDLALPIQDYIEREAKKMLTLDVSADALVLTWTAPPGCEISGGIETIYFPRKPNHKPIRRLKLCD